MTNSNDDFVGGSYSTAAADDGDGDDESDLV